MKDLAGQQSGCRSLLLPSSGRMRRADPFVVGVVRYDFPVTRRISQSQNRNLSSCRANPKTHVTSTIDLRVRHAYDGTRALTSGSPSSSSTNTETYWCTAGDFQPRPSSGTLLVSGITITIHYGKAPWRLHLLCAPFGR